MKWNVEPLMDAIDRYIMKENKDLEKTLSEEGFVAAGSAVSAINSIEDDITVALQENTEAVLSELSAAGSIEAFLSETWQKVTDGSELQEQIRKIFYEKFRELIGQFTYNWMLNAGEQAAEILAEEPAITAPTYDFIESWSKQLSEIMKLSANNQIEKILRSASEEKLSINQVETIISDSGIREAGYRARRTAVTEVLRLESYSQLESMIQDPLAYAKRWIHVMSAHPRENHMVMHGQEVFKREAFTLVGKDGITYRPKCPRDTSLPASESINCHCIMETVKNDNAVGISKEEMAKTRQQVIDEVNAEWAMDHQSDKVDIILSMDKPDQIRYFGGKKDGAARFALVQSGVVDTDEKLRNLYKTEENGKLSLKSLQELSEDGIFTVSDKRLKHSVIGDFSAASKQYPNGRMKVGGHSQASMDMCDEKGIEYTVTKTFSNGVRIGNSPTSKLAIKKTGNGQAWFPKSWDEEKIRIAGTAVANDGNPFEDGVRKTGVYDGVAVRILINDGNIDTICPDLNQSDFVEGVK